MITLVLTYRNRDLRIVKNCLDSLAEQSVKNFKVILVDYGSEASFAIPLVKLVKIFPFIQLTSCPVQGQLWNKCRAINIALRQTITPYFLVGDIDLIFHPHFMEMAGQLALKDKVTYFQYGFMSKEESLLSKNFVDFKVDFLGNDEVTGMTLFATHKLKEVNGYDEFYHGWGAEDTDIHLRLVNSGEKLNFYDTDVLVKHQWHPKEYRSKESKNPFHSKLERINHSYMQSTDITKRTKVNLNSEWGKIPLASDYQKLLNEPDYTIEIHSIDVKVTALLAQLKNFESELVRVVIKEVSLQEKMKQRLKKSLGKKSYCYWSMEDINSRFLEEIIVNYRNLPYHYTFDRQKGKILLLIQF
jgi:glycosyltransferase involved in cell wall biosynthesis